MTEREPDWTATLRARIEELVPAALAGIERRRGPSPVPVRTNGGLVTRSRPGWEVAHWEVTSDGVRRRLECYLLANGKFSLGFAPMDETSARATGRPQERRHDAGEVAIGHRRAAALLSRGEDVVAGLERLAGGDA